MAETFKFNKMGQETMVFTPLDYNPKENFSAEVSKYLARNPARFLWISNPEAPYTAWNCASLCGSGSICIGKYRIVFGKVLAREETHITFSGGFWCGETAVSCQQIILDTASGNGVLYFHFTCSGDVFEQLDAGIRYLMELTDVGENAYERGFLAAFSNHVFSYSGDAVFEAHISLCEILNEKQSYILLPRVAVLGNFLTTDGAPAICRPLSGASLVFEKAPDFYLGLSGEFECQAKGVVMGLFGGEYAILQSALRFVPHKSALLTEMDVQNQVTTSWLCICGEYHSTPSGTHLYIPEDGALCPYEPVAANFLEVSPEFPFMPWKGAKLDFAAEGALAEDLLYQKRFQILTAPVADGVGEELVAVTANGLCVGIDVLTNAWNWVGLANLTGERLPDVRLGHIPEMIRRRFLEKDCFLTAFSAEEFGALGDMGEISILADGWRILLSADTWTAQTILIIKYTCAFSIQEKLSDNPVFHSIIREAYSGDGSICPEYADFVAIMQDRDFQGTVFINASAFPEHVTPEVKFMLSSVKQIRAVYTAFRGGQITVRDGEIHVSRSVISSFLHYQADTEKISEEGCFQTVGISVHIEDSMVVSFNSRSELFIQKLLGEKAGCSMRLKGILEKDSQVYGYRFFLDTPVSCSISQSAVSRITVENVHLLLSGNTSIFVLDGQIGFIACEECDLFSYEELAYQNLMLKMDEGGNIIEDDSGLMLVPERSKLRDQSFAASFDAKISGYWIQKQGKADALGYCSVNTPVKQEMLGNGWNGIIWDLGIGSDGNLGENAEIGIQILMAWCGKAYYFGVREKDLMGFSLSGVLGVGFGGMEIQKKESRLLIKLCNIGVRLLNITIPQKSADLFLFGENGNIGWYMGYGEEEKW